jgi:hypothetical protein
MVRAVAWLRRFYIVWVKNLFKHVVRGGESQIAFGGKEAPRNEEEAARRQEEIEKEEAARKHKKVGRGRDAL